MGLGLWEPEEVVVVRSSVGRGALRLLDSEGRRPLRESPLGSKFALPSSLAI
jgi:hypothetical protein